MISQDYETLAAIGLQRPYLLPLVMESYAGADIAQWWGNILRQLQDMKSKAEEVNNDEYATLLGRFIRTWSENEITGSMNVEDIKALKTASEWASALPWNFSNYFSVLNNWLRRLLASTEQLPTGMLGATGAEKGGSGSHGGSGSLDPDKDPSAPQFGAEEEAGDMEKSPEDKVGSESDEASIADEINAAVQASPKQKK